LRQTAQEGRRFSRAVDPTGESETRRVSSVLMRSTPWAWLLQRVLCAVWFTMLIVLAVRLRRVAR